MNFLVTGPSQVDRARIIPRTLTVHLPAPPLLMDHQSSDLPTTDRAKYLYFVVRIDGDSYETTLQIKVHRWQE